MRSRSNMLVLLGIAFFVVGGVIVYLLTSDDDGGSSGGSRVTVVVGTEDISPGALADELIDAGKLQTKEFSANALPPGTISSLNQLEGAIFVQGYAASQPITSLGLQLQAARTFVVPEGFDAVAVQIDFVAGGAGYVNPGDHINLYASIDGALAGKLVPRAELLLTNVEVLDVNLTIPPRRGAAVDAADASAPRATGDNVTYLLALRTDDIEKIVWATEFEHLYASLAGDEAEPSGPTPGRDPETILSEEPNAAFNG